jgi:gliding motility-associated-like protein
MMRYIYKVTIPLLLLFLSNYTFGQTYCSPTYPNGCGIGNTNNYITNVAIGTINHSPPGCTVNNYTSFSTQIAAGIATPITVSTSGYIGAAVAVDLNNNGSFSDAGEVLAVMQYNNSSYAAPYSGNITIPIGTPDGSYRMRCYSIGGNSGGGTGGILPTDDPCATYGWGSFDDYTLIVYHQCATITSVAANPGQICTSGTTSLTCTYTSFSPATVKWYNESGTLVGTGSPFVSPVISTTTTFYAAADNGTCDTPRAPVTVIVIPAVTTPLSISPVDTSICEGKIVNITVGRSTVTDSVIAKTGTLTATKTPINATSTNSACELIYTSGELNVAGTITDIAFFKKSTNTTFAPGNVTIYMKNTTASAVTTNTSTTGYTQVYSGAWPNVGVATTSWANITLNTPFAYLGGANNLSILIVRPTAASTPVFAPTYRATSVAPNYRSSYYISTTNWSSGVSTMTLDTLRPDIKIKYHIQPTVNWTPVTSLFKDLALTQAMNVADTNTSVYAHPSVTTTYNAYSNLYGCLSVTPLTAHIVVKDTVHVNKNDSVCAGGSYTFGPQTLTTAGNYTQSFQAANFCDSVVTLHFTIRPYITNTVAINICQGQNYTFNGITYTTSQTGLKDTFSTLGCDSIVTLNLTVSPNITPTFTAIAPICNASTAPILPLTSNNGYTGTWSPATVSNTTTGTYTFTPSAGQCATTTTLTVTVTPNATPTFTAIAPMCSGSTAPVLPSTSTNGIVGIWSPSTVSNTASGTYTFTPNSSVCAIAVTMSVTVNPNVTPTFTAIAPICSGSTAPVLSTTSNNSITGTWSPATISNTATGTYTFTPTAGLCATTALLTVIVSPNVTPTFTLPASICNGATAPLLPATSVNGITGTWSPATVSNTATGTYTFTPTAGLCATATSITVNVNNNTIPTFTAIGPICNGSTPPALPGTSTNGITGTWSPATISNTTSGTYSFTPTVGLCATTATMTVTVKPIVTPTFTAIAPICSGSTAPVLPTTSNNGVTGTWSPAIVSNTASGTYTFTAGAGQCSPNATLSVTVTPNVTPTFTIAGAICNGGTAPLLPATSNNSIAGTWSPATVSNTTTGTYTFTPAAGICAPAVAVTVNVNNNTVPTFSAIPAFCKNTTAPLLPGTSTNGITGTWSPATVNNLASATYTFTPTAGLCALPTTMNITVKNPSSYTQVLTICATQVPFTWNGISNATTGSVYTTTSANNCDSVVTLQLSVLPGVFTANKDTAACGGLYFDNVQYNSNTIVKDTFFNYLGCDSFIRIEHITIYPNVPYTRQIDTLGCDVVHYEGNNYYSNTTLIDTFINQHGCDSVKRVVNIVIDKFELNLSVTPTDPYKGEQINLMSSANDDNYSITAWSPTALFPVQDRKEYSILANEDGVIIIHGVDEHGCTDTAEVTYKVQPLNYGVFMPNAFSPNGDGLNDKFGPRFYMKRAYTIKIFKIFNRWGQAVYTAANTLNGEWDGTKNDGSPADIGNYTYFMEIKFVDGKEAKLKGDVTLIR